MMASLAVPLMLRGPGSEPLDKARREATVPDIAGPGGDTRVVMILLEGASLDLIAPAAAEGRLPNFERLLERGASMHLATMRPTQPGPVWAAVATGKLPFKNGIRSAATYTPLGSADALEVLPDYCFSHALVEYGFLRERVHESGDLAARPIWNLLGAQGVPVGVVNWPVTQPVRCGPGLPRLGPFRAPVRVGGRCREHRRDLAEGRVPGGRGGGDRGARARPGRRADGGRQGPAARGQSLRRRPGPRADCRRAGRARCEPLSGGPL